MHVFLLIFIIAGQPERVLATCTTYRACSELGEELAEDYREQYHLTPDAVTFRVVPTIEVST